MNLNKIINTTMLPAFGWISFLLDVKNLLITFMIHIGILFLLLTLVYNVMGFFPVVINFCFVYLGAALILMIKRLGRNEQEVD